MNRKEMIDAIKADLEKNGSKKEYSNKELSEIIDSFVNVCKNTLVNSEINEKTGISKESIKLTGFGSLTMRVRKAKQGIKPRPPFEKIMIPEKKVVYFTLSEKFKEELTK